MLFKEWTPEWLESYVRPAVKERTYQTYARVTRDRLLPAFGACRLEELTPLAVQHFIGELAASGNRRTGGGLSSSTVRLIVAVLRSALKTAYTAGLTEDYWMERVQCPRMREKQVSCFTLSEQKAIERAVLADRRDKMLGIILCLYTGLRVGELLALEWGDVDFKNMELTVSRTRYDYGGGTTVTSPKTDSSRRTIPVPRQLIPLLRQQCKRSPCPFVISHGGSSVSIRSYQRSFELLLKRLDIPHRGLHALRHTFATRALECGMDVRTLAEILGHKNPTVTLNRYAHSMMSHKHDMMNRLGKMI